MINILMNQKRELNRFSKLPDGGDPWAPNNLLKPGVKEKHQKKENVHKAQNTVVIVYPHINITDIIVITAKERVTVFTDFMRHKCNETIYVETDQIHILFSSEPNMRCQLNINTTESKQMMLFFTKMCIQQHRDCRNIFLEINDGSSRDDPFIAGTNSFYIYGI